MQENSRNFSQSVCVGGGGVGAGWGGGGAHRVCLSIFQSLLSFYAYDLRPNKHGLVTYIQINVYIGNTLSWLNGG